MLETLRYASFAPLLGERFRLEADVVFKAIGQAFDPASLAAFRIGFGVVLVLVGLAVQRQPAPPVRPSVQHQSGQEPDDADREPERRGVVEFEPTDSANEKIEYIYRLLVHDKVIQPLAKLDVSQKAMRHNLALWASKQLPKDHSLLK